MKSLKKKSRIHTKDYLRLIGVLELLPRTSAFDPGYDPQTLESHLEQSSHLISTLKISMACWLIANETATRRKIRAAREYGLCVCAGGGPFEVAASFGVLPQYFDLCADVGMSRIEAGEGFTILDLKPRQVVKMAAERGLEVQYEVGKKHGGTFSSDTIRDLIDCGKEWLAAGMTITHFPRAWVNPASNAFT